MHPLDPPQLPVHLEENCEEHREEGVGDVALEKEIKHLKRQDEGKKEREKTGTHCSQH